MDASATLAALQWGATAIAEGILSEAGKNIYKSLRKEVEAIIPRGDIDGIQASQDAQKSERVLVQGAATASQAAQRHLDTLAYEILALREKHKIAQRDTKVDVIVERVFELFERHSIDRPTMAEILGVSLSTL